MSILPQPFSFALALTAIIERRIGDPVCGPNGEVDVGRESASQSNESGGTRSQSVERHSASAQGVGVRAGNDQRSQDQRNGRQAQAPDAAGSGPAPDGSERA